MRLQVDTSSSAVAVFRQEAALKFLSSKAADFRALNGNQTRKLVFNRSIRARFWSFRAHAGHVSTVDGRGEDAETRNDSACANASTSKSVDC